MAGPPGSGLEYNRILLNTSCEHYVSSTINVFDTYVRSHAAVHLANGTLKHKKIIIQQNRRDGPPPPIVILHN